MIKRIMITALLFSLVACSKKAVPTISTETMETIATDTVYVEKEKIVTLPGDSVEIYQVIPCPEVDFFKQATSESGRVKATVNISKGKLSVDCKADSLMRRIKWLEAHSNQVKETVKTVTINNPPVKYIPRWVWWLLIANIVYVAARVVIAYTKIPIRI